jgi:hypothetical protein
MQLGNRRVIMATRDTRTRLQEALDELHELEDLERGYAAATAHTETAAADTAVTITLAAPGEGMQHALAAVFWSYDTAPTAGQLTVSAGGSPVFDLDLGTSAGPGFYQFVPPLLAGDNAALEVTLGAGGGTAVGKLNIHAGTV